MKRRNIERAKRAIKALRTIYGTEADFDYSIADSGNSFSRGEAELYVAAFHRAETDIFNEITER